MELESRRFLIREVSTLIIISSASRSPQTYNDKEDLDLDVYQPNVAEPENDYQDLQDDGQGGDGYHIARCCTDILRTT